MSKASHFARMLASDPLLAKRLFAVKEFSSKIRASEYHLTNACNIRCEGCWFFTHDFDKKSKDERDIERLRNFVASEVARGINNALLIGGEPTLFPDRIREYVGAMKYVTISSNGLKPFPMAGFEQVTVAISLFGGGPLDDRLRAIKPGGRRFEGLFDTALRNYRNDSRVTFIYAITEDGISYIDETVQRIRDNGNVVNFNFYSKYDEGDPLRTKEVQRLLDEALAVRDRYPEAVISTPYYIRTMITGQSHWSSFSYDVCPSISVDHPNHQERLRNGNRSLPLFNTYAPDLKTILYCCTSGHCESCRDSQAVFSWLMVSAEHFMCDIERLREWVELAESYWAQFVWSPFHRAQKQQGAPRVSPRSGEGLAGLAENTLLVLQS